MTLLSRMLIRYHILTSHNIQQSVIPNLPDLLPGVENGNDDCSFTIFGKLEQTVI